MQFFFRNDAIDAVGGIGGHFGEQIRDLHQQVNLSESLGVVPGITVQNRQNYAQDLQIQSRGFGARSTFGVRGIRLIADGIPANRLVAAGYGENQPLDPADTPEAYAKNRRIELRLTEQ